MAYRDEIDALRERVESLEAELAAKDAAIDELRELLGEAKDAETLLRQKTEDTERLYHEHEALLREKATLEQQLSRTKRQLAASRGSSAALGFAAGCLLSLLLLLAFRATFVGGLANY